MIICSRSAKSLTVYERHLIKMFRRWLEDPKRWQRRCPQCLHLRKKCGRCDICACPGVQRGP